MFEQQTQEAGDNSQQFQAHTMTVITGIDERRAREIFDEKIAEIKEFSQEALAEVKNRTQRFENDLIPKLIQADLLNALKDPSIQILLVDAQKTAASTERPSDYALLSELLLHRIKKGSDRNLRAGISRAVDIVDEISDEALLGLTIAHAASGFIPVTGNIGEGIKTLADLFDKIICNSPPPGDVWIDHLDILDALRINYFGKLKKIDQLYEEKFSGYFDVGIDKTTDDFQTALELVQESNLPTDILLDHELRPGFARLRLQNIDRLDLITINSIRQGNLHGKTIPLTSKSQLSDEQKLAIVNIHALYSRNTTLKNDNIVEFFKLWDKYESLRIMRNWWNDIPYSFILTAVGRVLAHANAQRCDPTLPPLD